jgi:tetratricopeptide (TPR) repeat protein
VILITFGGLQLSGADFGRLKPLLLLAYLAIGGRRDRKHLATLFFPKNADRLNNLSITLSRLRKAAPGIIEADETRVWTNINTDVQELLTALENHDLKAALGHYQGMFLEGVNIDDCGEELEHWMFDQRELLAGHMRRLYLVNAEQEASRGNFEIASQYAETAYLFPGAPEPELEDLRRLYPLLLLGGSRETAHVRQEAEAFGLTLQSNLETIRSQYQPVLLGRERELERLRTLREGEWAWVRGGSGMGKTTLLKTISGHQLMARAGLPYATLEPFVGTALSDGEEAMLRMLVKLQGMLLIDGWHQMDVESQTVLQRLRQLRSSLKVVVASRDAPPFEVEHLLELTTISPDALTVHAGAWEATGGVPALVGAYLRGEPLVTAFEARLNNLSATARDICFALALLEEPDLVLVRRALELPAASMAQATNELLAVGLIENAGHIRLRQPALDWLESQQNFAAKLALRLARQKQGIEAFPLYQRARVLWEEVDAPNVQNAYVAWAQELLKRGFAQRALNTITELTPNLEVHQIQSVIFERLGRFKEALDAINNVPENNNILGFKSVLFWRLGKQEDAILAAQQALNARPESRANALNTLGLLALSKGEFAKAASHFRRVAALWLSLDQSRYLAAALENLAVAQSELGDSEHAIESFQKALNIAGENAALRAGILLNFGILHERAQRMDEAETTYKDAVILAKIVNHSSVVVRGLNNLGVIYHNQGKLQMAEQMYLDALTVAREGGEGFMIALILANLGELKGDIEAIQEAIDLFMIGGYEKMANQTRSILESMLNKTPKSSIYQQVSLV